MEGYETTASKIKEWLADPSKPEPRKMDVQQYRAKILDTAKAINSRANLSEAEKKDFEGLMKKADHCNEAIRRLDYNAEIGRAQAEAGTPEGGSSPFLRSGEKLSARHNNFSSGSLGGIIKALVTGDGRGMPTDARALATGGGAGYLVPESMSADIIDLARNKSALFRSGAALLMPMSAETVRLPKLLTGPVAEWHTENHALTGSDPEFGSVFLRAKTLACLATMSVELFEDGSEGLTAFIQNAMAEALAQEIDRAGINGSGASGEPGGILAESSGCTPYITESAAFPTYDVLLRQAQSLNEANAIEPYSYLMHPKMGYCMDTAKDSNGDYLKYIPAEALKMRRIVSNQVPTGITAGGSSTTSPIIMVAPESCVFGLRTNVVIEASRTSGDSFKNMQVQIRAYWRGDFAILRGDHICYTTGIKYL